MPPPKLFTPLQLGGITLPNRIVVSPMCQYSADDGSVTDWHLVHLGSLACSGAGMIVVEKTAVTREGRITHGCTGLYSEHNEAAMKRVVDACRRITNNPFGIQLGHSGRKGSANVPWIGVQPLKAHESPWPTLAPSPLPNGDGWPAPREVSKEDIHQLIEAYVAATLRAKRIGFDAVELHSAHGYFLHEWLSPLSNRRMDEYGKNGMKFPLEVAAAVREAWPKDRALGARITGSDWAEGGIGPEDAIAYARELARIGFDYVCVSSGGLPESRIRVAPSYQVPFAEAVKKAVNIKVRAVGMIADPDQAAEIVESGRADMIAMARAFLDNPRWVWHAAERFGVKIDYPPQYARSRHDLWPGARIVRPPSEIA